jgi:hypothetical protein
VDVSGEAGYRNLIDADEERDLMEKILASVAPVYLGDVAVPTTQVQTTDPLDKSTAFWLRWPISEVFLIQSSQKVSIE